MQRDHYYLVMEHCPDGDLRDRILRKRSLQQKFDIEQVVEWAFHIASALKFCHDRKVIHRDLKVDCNWWFIFDNLFQPDNIFLTHDGKKAKLGDFGVSIETKESAMLASTQAGTWQYMAPEMLKSTVFFQDWLLLLFQVTRSFTTPWSTLGHTVVHFLKCFISNLCSLAQSSSWFNE